MAALRAGVRTIEHGTYLDDECCDAMRETGAILVPTRTIIEDMLAFSAAVPAYAMAKLSAIADIHAQAVARSEELVLPAPVCAWVAAAPSDPLLRATAEAPQHVAQRLQEWQRFNALSGGRSQGSNGQYSQDGDKRCSDKAVR